MHATDFIIETDDFAVAGSVHKSTIKQLTQAARTTGNVDAYHNLAQLLLLKKSRFANSQAVAITITHCANAGFIASQRVRVLGQLYLYGRYVDRDKKQALKWFHKAAERGDLKSAMRAFGIGITDERLKQVIALMQLDTELH